MVQVVRNKRYYRERVKQAFQQLARKELAERSNKLVKRIAQEQMFRQAGTVMAYLPLEDEVDLRPLFRLTKRFCIPEVRRRKIVPVSIGSTQKVTAEDINLIIVPGRAFTADGVRIGRGYGYYDRFLASFKQARATLAPALALQIFKRLPFEEHDVKMDKVLVE